MAGRFWRSPSHANIPGTGLGLSIVTSLLQTFGGRLEVSAGPQGGLSVTCVLPAPPPTPPSPALPLEQAAEDARPPTDAEQLTSGQGLTER